MTFTIAVCTRNRATLLARTLVALQSQIDDHPAIELLVVDNGSTDNTAQIVRELAHERSNIRYILESKLGIAEARNRAAQEGQGIWLIYVDDDAVPLPGWFEAMQNAIQARRPVCVIGKVDLEWEDERARWFPPKYETLLSRYDLGEIGHFVERGGYLLTTNAAFDRAQLLALGSFRTDLGHRGKNLLGGEDNDMFNRLIDASCRIWYEPEAVVMHWVPRERQTRRWLIRRVFWDGATQPLLDYGLGRGRWPYWSEMGRDVRRVLRITLARRRNLLSAAGWFDLLLEWSRQIGRFWMNWRLFWH